MHMSRARIHAGVEQADHRMLNIALCVQGQCRDAEHAGIARMEARGLDIDNDPTGISLSDRPAPGVAHKPQDGTHPRQRPAHRIRVGSTVAQSE